MQQGPKLALPDSNFTGENCHLDKKQIRKSLKVTVSEMKWGCEQCVGAEIGFCKREAQSIVS